jgi:hypothetical protein
MTTCQRLDMDAVRSFRRFAISAELSDQFTLFHPLGLEHL